MAFAPDAFEFDDEGYSSVPDERSRFTELPVVLRQAIANCPEQAIKVTIEESRG